MKTLAWAPLVHARTRDVDFRPGFLARPHDLTEGEMTMLKSHVHAALGQSEKLRQGPRWLWLRKNGLQLFGCACLFQDLDAELARDAGGRQTYGFLGYVTRHTRLPVPASCDSSLLRSSLECLRERWLDKNYKQASLEATAAPYTVTFESVLTSSEQDASQPKLVSEGERQTVWPERDSHALWQALARTMGDSSLCLNFPSGTDIEPFVNASSNEVQAVTLLAVRKPPHAFFTAPSYETPAESERRVEPPPDKPVAPRPAVAAAASDDPSSDFSPLHLPVGTRRTEELSSLQESDPFHHDPGPVLSPSELPLHVPAFFDLADLRDVGPLVKRLTRPATQVDKYVYHRLSPRGKAELRQRRPSAAILLHELNLLIAGPSLKEDSVGSGRDVFAEYLSAPTWELLEQRPAGPDLMLVNRMILADTYQGELGRQKKRGGLFKWWRHD